MHKLIIKWFLVIKCNKQPQISASHSRKCPWKADHLTHIKDNNSIHYSTQTVAVV